MQVALHERLAPVGLLDLENARVRLHADSDVEYMMRLHACGKEKETIGWLREFAQPGRVLFDIGANVGSYSLAANAINGGRAKVVAFEPSPINFSQLLRNIALNGAAGSVIPLNVALGARAEVLEFSYSSLVSGAALHEVVAEADQRISHPIVVQSLDGIVSKAGLPAPGMLKLDVDGLEPEILEGARSTLMLDTLVTVLVELQAGAVGDRVSELLAAAGFSIRSVHPHAAGAAANAIFVRD